jgi:hypothetical protein
MTSEIRQTASKVVLLDRVMAQYGPETQEVRDLMRRNLGTTILRFWPEDSQEIAASMARLAGSRHEADPDKPQTPPSHSDAQQWLQSGVAFETIQNKLRQLSPRNDAQRWLQSRALHVSTEIAEARWLLHGQVGQTSLPAPFLVVLVCWLTIIFTSFGLFSPRNGTVIFVMLICALSAAAALFLILELDQPYHGLIRISGAPLINAFTVMGQ